MKITNKTLLLIITGLWISLLSVVHANEQVDALLANTSPPEGVIFEIATGDDDALKRAIPAIQRYSEALRKKFPELPIAVVTHGREQFSLTKENSKEYEGVHKQVRSLVKNSNITVHVCETYAGWKGLEAEAFPDYIDVAAAGPVQVNDYKALGYKLIIVDGDD